jgi:hypothetical protein
MRLRLSGITLPLVLGCPAAFAQDLALRNAAAPHALCAEFDVVAATEQSIVPVFSASGDAVFDVALGRSLHEVLLAPCDVRAPGFQLKVRAGAADVAQPVPPSVTFRGFLRDDPSSAVAATIVAGRVTALIRTAAGDVWSIQPITAPQRDDDVSRHIVHCGRDARVLPWHCGVTATLPAASGGTGNDIVSVADLVCEADPAFYQATGSNLTQTHNDITGVINAVSTIFTADVQIRMQIAQIVVDTGADPYTSNDPNTLLAEFRANWNLNRAGTPRDVAHLFTGRPLAQTSGLAGIAYTGTVCNVQFAYAVSQSLYTNNLSLRIALTAHELGHTFGATHCDAAAPCNIMCSTIGGCSGNTASFGPGERGQIGAFLQNATCLSTVPGNPVIATVAPAQVTAFRPGLLSLTGSGFTGVSSVQIGGVTQTTGFTVANDFAMVVLPVVPPQLGPTTLVVTNAAGASNAAPLSFVPPFPCALSVAAAVPGGTSLTWDFAGQPGSAWMLLVANNSVPMHVQGWTMLGFADLFAFGFTDANLGFGNLTLAVPRGTLSGRTFYSQLVEMTLGTSSVGLLSTSLVRTTFVVN